MPPLQIPQLMPASQVQEILRGMERRGEIPHDWETTWPWAKQVQTAHALYQSPEMAAWTGRAEEWRGLGEEYGGPLRGGAGEWILREPGQEAPTPLRTLGQVTGWVGTPEGLRVGTTPAKALKRSRLAVQEYGLPAYQEPATSWLRPPGGMPERGAAVQTAFMHGLPAGAGAVSPAFPEISQPYTKYVPITPETQITAVARPGAYATRGGALELLRTTQGRTTLPVKDWERMQLMGQPEVVPYTSPTRPEITEAYKFPLARFTSAQAGTVSMKAFGVKAFMGPGYDPGAMFPGAGVEQILPWPKDIRQFYAGALGTPYGRAWTQEHLGLPIPAGGVEWGTELDPQLMGAGEAFMKAHTRMRTVPLTVAGELLGTRTGGVWTEKTGPYWAQMPKGAAPEPLGGGRYQIQQRIPVMQAPFLSQYRREHVGRPFVSAEELSQLSLSRPQLAQRLWQEGAETRAPYAEIFRAMAATRRGATMGAMPITELPWGRIQERARAMMGEELDWVPEGQRVPGQYLARAAAEIHRGPVSAEYGGRQMVLPSPATFERLGVPSELGEEVVPMMTAWHRLAERAAMAVGPGGLQMPGAQTEMRRATRQTWMAMKRFAGGAGVQREVMGTRPTSAWEGPILAHTGLRPGEEIWGDIALREAAGARTPEELAALKQQITEAGGRGISTTGWRRPISDPFGQVGGQGARIMTEEMAREAGMAVSGLGRGIMTSPFALFEQRGDVDADRLIRFIEEKVKWTQGKPALGALQPGIERGLGTVRRIAGALRLHSPEETPEGSPLAQIFGSTAKWNEARAWMEEIQGTGRMEQVMEWFGGGGQTATWGELAQGVQRGLTSKEAMGRTYNRLIRELRPLMTETTAGRRAYRAIAAGPYQRTIDVTALSQGARSYLAMQESLGVVPKGGGFGFAEAFSPYERTEEGELRPRMSKMRGWGEVGTRAIGAVMGMEEIPEFARAYGIGGERFHKQVREAMRAGKQPGEILGMMGATEREAIAAAGPMIQATMRRLYSKMPEGEQSYVDYQGQERTVRMPSWAEAPAEAREVRAGGERMRTTLKMFSRRGFREVPAAETRLSFTPKQFEAALTEGMELTPEQQATVERARQEMGFGMPPETPIPSAASAYERQRASDQPVVDAWNGMMQQEIRQKMAARAPGAQGAPTPYATAAYGGAAVPPRQWPARSVPQGPSDVRLQQAIAGGAGVGGGGGRGGGPTVLPTPTPEEWGGLPGWQVRQFITRGPGGSSYQAYAEPMYARQRHMEALRGVEAGMGRAAPLVERTTRELVDSFTKLNEVVKEGRGLRVDENKEIKSRIKAFTEARQLAEEWQRQAKETYPLTGEAGFEAARTRVRGALEPLYGRVQEARMLQREMEAMLPGVPVGPGAPPGGRGGVAGLVGGIAGGAGRALQRAVGGWGMMYLNRMRSMFISPVQQMMGEYAGGQLQAQQAMYMAGLPTGMAGAPIDILQARAQRAQFRTGVGEAAWQTWGGLTGLMGGEPGPLAPGIAIGAPALGVGLAGAYLAGGPVGIAAGLATAGVGAASYGLGARKDVEAMSMAAASAGQYRPGLGGYWDWLKGNFRGVTGMLLGGQPDVGYGQQIMAGNLGQLRDPEGRLAAMDYFINQRLSPQLPGMEPGALQQLTGAYMGMTGITNLGQVNMDLLQAAGQRAQMLGIQPGQAFQPWQQLAGQMGYAPTSQQAARMAEISLEAERVIIETPGGLAEELQPRSEREIQQQLWEWGNVAPLVQQMRGRFGMDVGPEQLQWLGAEGMGPQRYRMQQLMGGNQIVASQIGRQLGIPELVTMQEGGLPIYTTEMRGLQDVMQQQQRGYRDWQAQQQWDQMQANQQYTRATWTIQDQQRALQAQQADWQYGFGQRQFALAGQQWQQQFALSGQQWQQSFGLGQRMFEARIGFQQQDFAQQQERAAQQYQWRMEDWAYGENVNQLQYGWRMEDLTESIRYSTGRQRRQLMQQQERGTILESMRRQHSEEQRERMEEQRQWQEEDFEQAKQRNEELIALQREQFELQKRHWEENRELAQRHHEEDRQMQQERMEKSREFYLQGKELADEQIKLQREHWEQQQEWAETAWEKAREQNEAMDQLQDQYRDLQRQQQDTIAAFTEMVTLGEEFAGILTETLEGMQRGGSAPAPTTVGMGATGGYAGLQAGGFVGRTAAQMLHEGEYVVPSGGQLVLKGDPGDKELWQEMVSLLGVIAEASKNGKAIIVQTNDANRAQEHVLSLEDGAWGLMPG